MPAQRSFAFLPALAILTVAGCLSACGVKGDLEPPAAAAQNPAPQQQAEGAQPDPSAKKIFLEQSAVRSGGQESVIPSMPPKEWAKKGDYQPVREKSAVRENPLRAPDPEKPFVLDWLL